VLKQSNALQLLYFTAPWCEPCARFRPVVQAVARELGVPVRIVDAKQELLLAQRYGVQSVPTVVLLRGGKVERALYAPQSTERFRAWVR
jgi:thioredoxin 1